MMTFLSYSFTCSSVRGRTDPFILNPDTREDCAITFMKRPLPSPTPQERSFSAHLILSLVGARNRLVELEERKISYSCRELYPLLTVVDSVA